MAHFQMLSFGLVEMQMVVLWYCCLHSQRPAPLDKDLDFLFIPPVEIIAIEVLILNGFWLYSVFNAQRIDIEICVAIR